MASYHILRNFLPGFWGATGRFVAYVFLFSLGFGITIPAVPLFARDLGAKYLGIGIIGVAYGLSYTILAVPLGRLSDRIGRKWVLTFSSILALLASCIFLVAERTEHLVAARLFEGVAWGAFFPSLEASSGDLSEKIKHGKAMGLLAAVYGSGFACGTLVSGVLVENHGYQSAFLLYLLVSFLSLLLISTLRLNHGKSHSEAVEQFMNCEPIRPRHTPTLLYSCLISAVYSVVLATVLFLFPAYAKEMGYGVFSIGLMLTVFWIFRITSFLTLGHVSDTIGRKTVLVPALAAMTVASALLVLGGLTLFSSIVLLGVSTGAIFPVTIALISDNVSRNQRCTAMGYFEAASAGGQMVAPLIGGFLAQTFDPRYPYVFCAFVSLICALAVIKMKNRAKPLPTT